MLLVVAVMGRCTVEFLLSPTSAMVLRLPGNIAPDRSLKITPG